MIGDVFYFTADGRRTADMDSNVSDNYARTATRPSENIYSVWTCRGDGDPRYSIVTHKGRVIHDGTGEWTAPWER